MATQDKELQKRLDPEKAGERIASFLRAVTMEVTMIARSCGKSNVHHLEPEDRSLSHATFPQKSDRPTTGPAAGPVQRRRRAQLARAD
ncbi:MAG: hypothetical protein HY784_00825, partial [Chloroflexi bacterium]|nr:hypothetical protein [Chloroflexota bacterium]